MKRKLYSNMRRMTAMFSLAIVCVTLTALMLRLTVLGDLAAHASAPGSAETVAPAGEDVKSGLFDYTIASKVSFETPQSRGGFRIENLETNQYLMSVSIILPQTGDEIFYTGFLEPGQSRQDAALHIPLQEGTYECVARVTAYDPVSFQSRGSEECGVTLYIGNQKK